MSCFSLSSPSLLPSPLPGSGNTKRASEEANEPVASRGSHSQRAMPFGHAILPQDGPSNVSHRVPTVPGRYTIPDGQALPLGTEGILKHAHQSPRSFYSAPLYFQPTAGCDRGILVTGLENSAKYSILRHLIRSAWSTHDNSLFRGILCFTTDHGSFGVVTSATQAAQDVGQQAEVIVLTVPWKVSELSATLAGTAKNISVLPIRIHLQDVSLNHLAFLQSFYQPDWHLFHAQEHGGPESVTHSDVPAQLRCFLSTTESIESSGLLASPDWVSWTRSRQVVSSNAISAAAEKGASLANSPLLLCVDLSGFDPTELVIQHTLADIITKSWTRHVQAPTTVPAQSLVVCDDAHTYLSQDESPFSRTLAGLVAPVPLSNSPATKMTPHLIILSQSPVSLAPNVLDHLSYLIIHRFTAPRWLQALENHFFLQPRVRQVFNVTDGVDLDANSTLTSTIEQILDLEDGRVLIYLKGHDQQPQQFQANNHSETAGSLTNGHPRNVFGPIQRPTVKPATTSMSLGRQLLMVSLNPVSIPTTSAMRTAGLTALYPPANLDDAAAKRSPHPAALEIGSTNAAHHGSIRSSLRSSSAGTEGGSYEPWRPPTETHLGTPASGHVSLHSPPGISTIGRSIPRTTSSPFDTIMSPTASSPEVSLNRGTAGSFTSTYLSPGVATSPMSPTGRGIHSGGTTFSPFSMARRSQEVVGTSQYTNSFSNSSSSISSHFFPAQGDGGGVPSPHLDRYRPITTSMSSASEGHFSKADTDSGGGDFVDVGAMRDALPTSNGRPQAQAGVATSGGATGSSDPSSSYGLAALGLKRSYAGVTAPVSDGTIQRRATAILLGSQTDTAGRTQINGVSLSNGPNQFISPEGVGSTGPSSSPPPPPPVYPESFFWPLLDALEKARVQVSSPHNRAQCVRHSVVGQELPPSARARLGLTFKEYVAAAARQGVVVTGDSGDKAWIAMQDWRFPGKMNLVNGHSAAQGQRMANK